MTTARSSLRLAGLLAFVATLIVACSAPSALPAPAAPAAATTAGTAGAATTPGTALSVDRVTAHLKALAVDIGIRSAGSEEERRAARYIAGVLTDAGYTATIEPFTFSMPAEESSSVTIEGGKPFTARLIEGSALGLATGALVDGGTGTATQIEAAGARGRVVLVRRGDIPFSSKVANAAQAGAVAVLVVNNESGQFRGTLGRETASIPALAIDGGQWEALRAALGRTINLDASRSTKTVTSQNVVGRRGATCRAYIGSHYDSVPEGPGANDNASGTASMLEIARVRATDGLCAIAFGSEETGLNGSQAFVRDHSPKGAVFMVNFDMMGRMMIGGQASLTVG
ncbi:MAG: M28 family peptidase, partial [Chloroflexota bacterium]